MQRPEDQILTIFGASGDLSKRKLLPALFQLFLRGLLPDKFRVLCVGRTKIPAGEFARTRMREMLDSGAAARECAEKLEEFFRLVEYFSFDSSDAQSYGALAGEIERVRSLSGAGGRVLFYLGTPPAAYPAIVDGLKASGLAGEKSSIIVEKPFGSDLESARLLNAKLNSAFPEERIFRIDHYLGKETVQNILVLRFSNEIFEPIWDRNHIESVEISVSETVGVEKRGAYYESAGAMRDMIQNHLLELMTFVAMECPANLGADSIRDEMAKVLSCLRPMDDAAVEKNTVRGQYAGGMCGGVQTAAYVDEPNVAKDSAVETYVAMKAFIDNRRWSGVPFYFYTGKRLAQKRSEISVNFKPAPPLFSGLCGENMRNKLSIIIQPDEGISLQFALKIPGKSFSATQVSMDFNYSSLADVTLPDAYSRLILDAMSGDSTLFARSDAVEAGWKFVDPIIAHWKRSPSKPALYPCGSDGPTEAVNMKLEHSASSCALPLANALTSNLDGRA